MDDRHKYLIALNCGVGELFYFLVYYLCPGDACFATHKRNKTRTYKNTFLFTVLAIRQLISFLV
jgi:hypothetical protein